MLTLEQLRLILPDLPPAKGTAFLPFLEAAMAEFAIATPARAAAFLAQIAHESGQLRFMQEIWGPTDHEQARSGKDLDPRGGKEVDPCGGAEGQAPLTAIGAVEAARDGARP